MKIKVLGVSVIALLATVTTAAAQHDCSGNPPLCVKNGGTQTNCNDAKRMADCRRTGQYVSPSGRVFQAVGKGATTSTRVR